MTKTKRERRSLLVSVAIHAFVIVLFLRLAGEVPPLGHPLAVLIVTEGRKHSAPSSARASARAGEHGRGEGEKSAPGLDLRPGFMRGGPGAIFARKPRPAPTEDAGAAGGAGAGTSLNSDAADLIAGDLRAADAFDNLAENIGAKLDYPDVLVDEGVQGNVSVDLYFDSRGLVDEERSEVDGDRGSLRGATVRAVREGLLSWYRSDSAKLRLDEYRNQHFRADFTLSYSLPSLERIDKLGTGSYHFLRRRMLSICLYPGAIDLACTAAKIAGFIERHTSDKYDVKVAAVMDVLNAFDEKGLRGINAEIADARAGG